MTAKRNPLYRASLFTVFTVLTISCGSSGSENSTYTESIDAWHRQRIESLKENDGWLSLAGLYRLERGTHTFGADSSNAIVFPGDKVPATIGRLTIKGETVTARIDEGVTVGSDGTPAGDTTLKIFGAGRTYILTHGPLEWFVIERGGELFLRLKDTDHPNLESFDGIDRFPVSREWRVEARFREFVKADTIGILNVLGQVNREPLHGLLEFELEGSRYTLAPLGDPESDDEFFIIFGDKTNGEESYGGGRYLYVDTPDENGITYIDFNRAYNPPCVFTEYATCPLPPPRNRLDVEIRAGEKNYQEGAPATKLYEN